MIQGTGSDVGKSIIVAGLCRIAKNRGIKVAPFKPQNMSNNAAVTADGGEIGRAQALQALACGLDPVVDMNPVLLKPETDIGAQVIVQGKRFATMKARLGDIAFAEDEGPWAAGATEILAYSAVRAKNFEEAEMLYLKIRSMQSATMGIVGRSAEMLSIIQPQIGRPALITEPELEPAADPAAEAASETGSAAPDDKVEAGEISGSITSTPPEGE